jgi:hypothetical protein
MSSPAAVAEKDDVATAQNNYKIIQEVGNFEETEVTPPDFDYSKPIEVTKSPFPQWKYGDGVPDNGKSLAQMHHEIDPCSADRPMINNCRVWYCATANRFYQHHQFRRTEESLTI